MSDLPLRQELEKYMSTGRVRGLLCRTCNGILKKQVDLGWLRRAKAYLAEKKGEARKV